MVEFPEEESVLSAFLKDVTRKADHYADHMFQESEEMDQEEIHRLEKLIPGTDVEEDEPEELPGRFRRPRRPEPPPPDTAPQELARRYGKGPDASAVPAGRSRRPRIPRPRSWPDSTARG